MMTHKVFFTMTQGMKFLTFVILHERLSHERQQRVKYMKES